MRVKRETVTEQCIQLLRSDIFERRLLPGAMVTEDALAREMGVSRATVREVLNTLTVEGLLTRNPTTRSLYVTRLGPERIREIYQARRFLEVGGVAAYADREDAALHPLVTATDKLTAAIDSGDHREVVKNDIACHVAIVGLVGAPDLAEFYESLLAKLQLAMTDVARSHQYNMQVLRADHVQLVDLLKERRIDEAKNLVVDRINRAEEQLLAAARDKN
ncbi:GntR family transcriptional regulator [Pelagibacterium sp. H642]|uniref:GntR family transcriptional regulator n=1 Tax=Pelagibacterium sp. H642 TaxID=1881069 RepID=UPI0028149F14|nr:GntR family transcriptional regulator [Pelagibacterium sp. H642]WMT89372.1 GntR family transcriptional regulator [Pelagibacterium sp. H642]